MKIAILGTRGIPNQYGGFERLAEILSAGLVAKGIDVSVYNPNNHLYKKSDWKGVQIIHKYCPPKFLGSFGQFVYDLNCIVDSRSRNFDVIIQLGYTSSSIWFGIHSKKAKIITNMDGIEWQRTKYGWLTKRFLKYAEKLAVKRSHILVADSMQIKNYLNEQYAVDAHYISYGSDIFQHPDPEVLKDLHLEPNKYYLNIARFQADNNQEMIINGYLQSNSVFPLVLVGDYNNRYGGYLRQKFPDKRIIFSGAIFDKKLLDNLRYYSKVYFHGHSAGGTNPSLLEAMGAKALICAHNNYFNHEVLSDNAFYFNTETDISKLLSDNPDKELYLNWIQNNQQIIQNRYCWESVINTYFELLNDLQ